MLNRENQNKNGPGYNRRDFLKGSGVAVAATAMATAATAEADANTALATANVAPSDATRIALNVNGKTVSVKVEPRVTLLEVLRNDLNLTGCKDACDRTTCGSCTVMIDGKAVYACARLAHECSGKRVTTVESLRKGDQVDEVISGFVKHDASQCGFCTPGFVVATRVFLNQKPNASLEQIRNGLGGNICRCGTYDGITKCALELANKGGA